MISIDTLRADHLGCYGRVEAQTPVIDALAAAGVVFDAAVSPVPLTLPAHATMLTGLAPPRHGVRLNTESRLQVSTTTLAERLREAGYRTGAFVGASPMAAEGGLAQGFEVYDDVANAPGERAERDAGSVFAAAREWIAGTGAGEPVFAFVHVFDPHWPLENVLPGSSEPSYDGEIAYVDRALGEFLAALPDTPRWRDRVTVIVSDHGEGLGEHGEASHGLLVYESTLRVPWVVHRAGGFEPRRVAQPVGLIDLAPTLVELAGAAELDDVEGESLIPVLHGADPPERELYFESLYGYLEFGWARLRGLRAGPLKYTAAPMPELYDLHEDPAETNNLHAVRRDEVDTLRQRLSALGDGGWTRVEMDPEALERLSSLGYVSARPATVPEDVGLRDPKEMVEVFHRFASAVALIETGRHAEGFDRFAALENDFADSPQFFTQYANAAAGLERWETAGRLYARALALDPENQTALENLGVALLKVRRVEQARQTFGQLLEINPDHANAHFLAGGIDLWSLRAYESGVAHWRRVLEIQPDHERARQIRNVLEAYAAGGWTAESLRDRFRSPS